MQQEDIEVNVEDLWNRYHEPLKTFISLRVQDQSAVDDLLQIGSNASFECKECTKHPRLELQGCPKYDHRLLPDRKID